MGGQVSAPTAEEPAQIDILAREINEIASKIACQGALIGWDPENRSVDCDRITYYYKDSLAEFNLDTLKKAAYNIGISYNVYAPENCPQIPQDEIKTTLCSEITSYYAKKMDLIYYIQQHLESGCNQTARVIHNNFAQQIADAPEKVKVEALKRLRAMDNIIERFYSRLRKNLRTLLLPISAVELAKVEKDTYQLLRRGFYQCCLAQDALRQFIYEPRIDENGYLEYYSPRFEESAQTPPPVKTLFDIRSPAELTCSYFLGEEGS